MSQNKVAKSLGCSSRYVFDVLKENNITTRSNRINSLKYECDKNYFETIDTEEKAYWLGFIYADGYIISPSKHNSGKLGIALAEKDLSHLNKFKDCIKSTHKINIYNQNKGFSKNTNYARIIIINDKIYSDLIDKGVLPNKSLKLKFPDIYQLPEQFYWDFIRGYFDGDGSISIKENGKGFCFGLCGTYEFLDKIKSILEVNNKLGKRHKNETNNYTLSFGGNIKVLNVLEKLYGKATVYLDRKFERYMKLKQRYSIIQEM